MVNACLPGASLRWQVGLMILPFFQAIVIAYFLITISPITINFLSNNHL